MESILLLKRNGIDDHAVSDSLDQNLDGYRVINMTYFADIPTKWSYTGNSVKHDLQASAGTVL